MERESAAAGRPPSLRYGVRALGRPTENSKSYSKPRHTGFISATGSLLTPGLLSSAPSGDSSDPLSPSHNPTGGILWSVAWRKPIRNWSLLAERIRASATDFFQQAKSG